MANVKKTGFRRIMKMSMRLILNDENVEMRSQKIVDALHEKL